MGTGAALPSCESAMQGITFSSRKLLKEVKFGFQYVLHFPSLLSKVLEWQQNDKMEMSKFASHLGTSYACCMVCSIIFFYCQVRKGLKWYTLLVNLSWVTWY
jgi:hypothetical protein